MGLVARSGYRGNFGFWSGYADVLTLLKLGICVLFWVCNFSIKFEKKSERKQSRKFLRLFIRFQFTNNNLGEFATMTDLLSLQKTLLLRPETGQFQTKQSR